MEVLERHGVTANFLLRHSPSQKIKKKKKLKKKGREESQSQILKLRVVVAAGSEGKIKEENPTSGNGEEQRKEEGDYYRYWVWFGVRNKSEECCGRMIVNDILSTVFLIYSSNLFSFIFFLNL